MSSQDSRGAAARDVAVEVVLRVTKDGAWTSRALDAALARASLQRRDAALATAIAYGTMRRLPSIDALIDRHAERTDPFLRAVLRCAIFEILHLDRVPVRAAVHEAVTAVRRKRGKKVAGFVNAVLRKIKRPDPVEVARLELPPWLKERLANDIGPERAASLDRAEPTLDIRLFADFETWCKGLPEYVSAERLGPRSARLSGARDPRRLPGFNEGAFVVQEYGSQRVADAVHAQPGETVADCCAGRGGKTLPLADAVGAGGRVVSIELHASRMKQIRHAMEHVGLQTALETHAIDLRVGTGGLQAVFDRVLVDAPCTGTGTLHRRPEILLRLRPEDIEKLQQTQRSILANAALLVRPGGTLTYAVCSLLRDEGPGVEAYAGLPSDFEAVEGNDPDGWTRLGPWNRTDGYQLRQWRRDATSLPKA